MTQRIPTEKIPHRIGVVQAMFAIKIMAGKLYEGWNLLQNKYYKTALSKTYRGRLDKVCIDALKRLKAYFGKPNAIQKIRNLFAFHYDPKNPDGTKTDDWILLHHEASARWRV